jgi:phosphatidylserine decarboxylase
VPEARPIEGDESVVVSPVDGTVSQGGKIEAGTLIQAKGVTYSLDQLLSYQRAFVEKFDGGEFVTIYLSPRDYHRIHMPINGQIEASTYIPGELYPVNKTGVKRIPELFAINERVITYIRTSFGHMALIKVGATNVGSIKVVYDESIVTNPDKKLMRTHKEYQPPSSLAKGEEIGRFEFGSTVILLFEPGQIDWIIPLIPGTKVKMGQAIATVIKEKAGERNV